MTHESITRLRAFDENGKLRRSEREKPLREKSRRRAPEAELQVKLVVALRRRLPEGSLVFHVPNQRRGKTDAIKLKTMGVLAGMPDLLVLLPFDRRREARLLAIEVKARSGALSESQVRVAEQLGALGVPYFLARDVESALKWIGGFVELKGPKNGLR